MPEWTKFPDRPLRIALLIFDAFSNLCLANCIEPLRAANTLAPAAGFDWQLLSPDGSPVRSSSGIEVLPHAALPVLTRCDRLFVLASYGHERHDHAATRQALSSAARRSGTVVGFDAAPWLLASAGLLAGRRATVHWDLLDAFAERFLDVGAERARVIRDGPVVTCAGAMSALDFTLDLIAAQMGIATRLDVEALFMQGDPPVGGGQAAQADPLVARAMAQMRDHLERPLPLNVLAAQLSTQPRTLDRRCRAALGAPPGTVYRQLRLSAARKLIEESRLGLTEIALRCGYDSAAALSRAIRRQYGRAPRLLRQAARARRV